jgi:hypothetical protein
VPVTDGDGPLRPCLVIRSPCLVILLNTRRCLGALSVTTTMTGGVTAVTATMTTR